MTHLSLNMLRAAYVVREPMTTNPLDSLCDVDTDAVAVHYLEALDSGCGGTPYCPPRKAGEFIRRNINQGLCESARIVKLVTGEFFLRWDEMSCPSKRREIPVTGQQAFALVVTAGNVSDYDKFQPEIDALWG